MEETTISSKGQLVIPKYLRDALGLKPGSIVLITKVENKLILVPKPDDPVKGLIDAGQHIAMKNIRRHIKEE
ncbi:MAG: AbrB/MazE/SpoVT family DNA-binding domain-containing protein [Candidatus Aenigmarchaeota archaeon]|nr:AbrB/MazE/SpoVT family DNA-binding domain-containing protein [Candidatus Aenigmarchaeota archaeon]